jgi:hypothetical protein
VNRIKHNSTLLLAVAAVLALAGFSLASSNSTRWLGSSEPAASDNSEVQGYQTWNRVNREPAMMDAARAAMCAQMVKTQNPHQNKFIAVFVNDVGKQAMLFQKQPKFPRGTAIVKQKLANPTSTEPEALTAMIKRAEGYNPEGGDWEYLVLTGNGSTVVSRGRNESCQACHALYKNTDFITRQYLSAEDRERLQ